MQLADHVALITGSARGIGRATARRLAQEGANIVIADINATGAEEAAAEGGVAAQRADRYTPRLSMLLTSFTLLKNARAKTAVKVAR